MDDVLIWIGIVVCMTQSAVFSGSNLAVFSLSRLRLESAAAAGDANAQRALALRRDANFTLVTILTGNVTINPVLPGCALFGRCFRSGILLPPSGHCSNSKPEHRLGARPAYRPVGRGEGRWDR